MTEHISKPILERCELAKKENKLITLEEYSNMRMNSWKFRYVADFLTDEAYIWTIEHALENITHRYDSDITYEGFLLGNGNGIKKLLERFKKCLRKQHVKNLSDILKKLLGGPDSF